MSYEQAVTCCHAHEKIKRKYKKIQAKERFRVAVEARVDSKSFKIT